MQRFFTQAVEQFLARLYPRGKNRVTKLPNFSTARESGCSSAASSNHQYPSLQYLLFLSHCSRFFSLKLIPVKQSQGLAGLQQRAPNSEMLIKRGSSYYRRSAYPFSVLLVSCPYSYCEIFVKYTAGKRPVKPVESVSPSGGFQDLFLVQHFYHLSRAFGQHLRLVPIFRKYCCVLVDSRCRQHDGDAPIY